MASLNLCVTFFHWQKTSPGCQNHNLGVQSKNSGKKFLSQMFFSKVFQVLSRGTWKLSGKLLAELSKPHSMGPEEHIHSNIFESSLKTFQFSGLLLKIPWQQLKINFRVEKTAKNVSRSKLRKNLFRKKKVAILFFFTVLSEVFFVFLNF